MTALCILTWLPLSACERRDESPGASPPPAPTHSSEARPRPATRAKRVPKETRVKETPVPDLFKRGQRVVFETGSSLIQAVPARFSRSALGTQKLHLASFSESRASWLAVDHEAPRRAKSAYFTLSELLNEDVELSPGAHFLTAFEFSSDEVSAGASEVDASRAGESSVGAVGRLFVAGFSVDVDAASLSENPGCLLFTPELTKNGKRAAQEIRFLAVPLVSGLDKVEYSAVSGTFKSRGEAAPGVEMILEGPPAGDVELSARCFSAGDVVGSDEQTVTVNPEALEKEKTP